MPEQEELPSKPAENALIATNLSPETQAKVQERYLKMNPSSYGWLLTLNNPEEHGYSQELIIGLLQSLHLKGMCMVKEIGDSGTPHYHAFLYVKNKIRFSTVHNLIPEAHIDRPRGTALQCRDYIRKTGTLTNQDKAHTQVEGSYYEWGEFPTANEEQSPAAAALLEMLQKGKSTTEILADNARYLLSVSQLNAARNALQEDSARTGFRDVKVIYIWSALGIDLTACVYDRHKARDICRIAQYGQFGNVRFDSYSGQDVLLLDDYLADIPLRSLLQMMSGHPYYLPARFNDKPACYRYLYIVSEVPPEMLYSTENEPQVLCGRFERRIDKVITFDAQGTLQEYERKPTIESTAVESAAPKTKKGEIQNDTDKSNSKL